MLTQPPAASLVSRPFEPCRSFLTTASLAQNRTNWMQREKYTVRPIGVKKTGGRDHTGKSCLASRRRSLLCMRGHFKLKFTPFTCSPISDRRFCLCRSGRIRTHGIGGGHKQRHRMIDFQRLNYEAGKEDVPFDEKVVEVRYDPCR